MKRKLLARTLMAAFVALPMVAMAEEPDCFPMCAAPATVEIAVDMKVDARLDTVNVVSTHDAAGNDAALASCNAGLMKKAEDLNNKIKPIREIIGYVRSPQGLAIKLVNDHIVKIPAWVGYAMDPIGSIKRRAIDEVKTQIKVAMDDGKGCTADPANEITYPAIDIYAGHSV